MKIIIARHSGFCMGVRMAMNTVLKIAHEQDRPIQTLGPLIHNPQTMELLRKKRVTAAATPGEVRTDTVVVRTHSVAPDVREALDRRGLSVVDATCPHVKRIHDIINEHYQQGYTILIFGDAGHAEVIGLQGYARDRGHLINSPGDLAAFPPGEKICLVAQTTQGLREYQAIKERAASRFQAPHIFDTVCRATDRRQTEVEALARGTDAVVVVGGKNSANSTRLAKIARRHNARAFHIETEQELSPADFEGLKSVAVVSGASTPSWLLNRVTDRLKEFSNSRRPAPLRWLNQGADLFVAYNGYLALCALLLTWAASNLQARPVRLSHLLTAALYINSMYILNRITNIRANQYEEIFHSDVIHKHRRFSVALCLMTGLASMALAFRLGFPEFTLTVLACVAGILYHVPLLPKNNLPLL
ncbi:MAG: 4-hydroxy-3-methylbut-2-enyl diphosphate reductase, partial [Fibrobacterota bacterium]